MTSIGNAKLERQYTGTFKARGAQNFIRAHLESGVLPKAGITIASGGQRGSRVEGADYGDALAVSHAYDHRLIAAGAGTLMEEIHDQLPDVASFVEGKTTCVVSV